MKLLSGLIVSVLALAACSPAPAGDTTPGAAAKPAAADAAAKRMALPDCAKVEAKDSDSDGWQHPDCRLALPDASRLAVEAHYAPAEDDSTEIKLAIVAPGDATVQTLTERMSNTFNAPSSEDVDKDGKADLLVPLETGNVNTTWAVWRQVDGPKFVRIGELGGVEIAKTASGFVSVEGRSTAADYYVEFHQLAGDQLQLVVTVSVSAIGDPEKPGITCTIEPGDAFASLGITPAAAKTKFCAEPAAQALIKDFESDK